MISAIIILFNPDLEHLDIFLENLLLQVDSIILVDNSPKDSKNRGLPDKFLSLNKIIYIDLLDNRGIAFAHNKGIQKAKDLNHEYVIIFDQDSNIEDDFIASLIALDNKLLKEGHKVAAVGPAYIDIKTNQIAPAIRFNGLKVIRDIPISNKDYTKADYIISSGSLIRISTLEKIGFMKDDLFIDYVDVEWGLRAKIMGYSCYIANKVIMHHSIGDKSIRVPIFDKHINIHSNFRKYFIIRNAIYLILYSDLPLNWRLVQIPKTIMYFIFLLIYIKPRLDNVKIFYLSFKDAILKNMSKGSMK